MLFLGLISIGMVGCGDKAKTTRETTVSTPEGTTTTTETKEVKQTGDNPPPAQR
jgi:hypothetical protein